MTGKYARDTQVPVERSRAEVERTLARYGANAFSYGWNDDRQVIMFEAHGRRVRFDVVMPHITECLFTEGGQRRSTSAAEAARDQAVRQRWRALVLVVKAKLEAVDVGIVSFEEEFLAHIMLPDGSKVSEWIEPQLEETYASGKMPAMLPGSRIEIEAGD